MFNPKMLPIIKTSVLTTLHPKSVICLVTKRFAKILNRQIMVVRVSLPKADATSVKPATVPMCRRNNSSFGMVIIFLPRLYRCYYALKAPVYHLF